MFADGFSEGKIKMGLIQISAERKQAQQAKKVYGPVGFVFI